MSKRKGVSAEEKRTRVLQIFYEKKEVFQLKELEKIAPKEKGVIAQSVKEVVQALVDDGLVDTDKIGTSVHFWSFPSKAICARQTKLADLEAKIVDSDQKLAAAERSLSSSVKGKENSSERNELLARLGEAESKQKTLEMELAKFRDNDPEILKEMEKEVVLARDSANRWTDNIFSIKSWAKNKFNIEESAINKNFAIPEDMDYI